MNDTTPAASVDDDEPEYDYLPEADPAAFAAQVPSYIAIIRIVAVLGMGVCIAFGLFIMLTGLRGVLIGVPIVLLAIPCYYGMGLAERLAMRAEERLRDSDPA